MILQRLHASIQWYPVVLRSLCSHQTTERCLTRLGPGPQAGRVMEALRALGLATQCYGTLQRLQASIQWYPAALQ